MTSIIDSFSLIVASFTDAWIETLWEMSQQSKARVASFTDAWIETREGLLKISSFRSHLLQMRGLKRLISSKTYKRRNVASFTDAWIETFCAAMARF